VLLATTASSTNLTTGLPLSRQCACGSYAATELRHRHHPQHLPLEDLPRGAPRGKLPTPPAASLDEGDGAVLAKVEHGLSRQRHGCVVLEVARGAADPVHRRTGGLLRLLRRRMDRRLEVPVASRGLTSIRFSPEGSRPRQPPQRKPARAQRPSAGERGKFFRCNNCWAQQIQAWVCVTWVRKSFRFWQKRSPNCDFYCRSTFLSSRNLMGGSGVRGKAGSPKFSIVFFPYSIDSDLLLIIVMNW
jgi:hypothetical protein